MADLNKVIFIGRLTRDPETTEVGAESTVTKFGLAINNGFGDKREVAFVDVTAWNQPGKFTQTHFKKGNVILIEGRLSMDQWETDKGEKRSRLYITAERVGFASPKPKDDTDQ
jgi:single-strand DNA-binding protein